MASFQSSSFFSRKVLLLYLLFFLFTCVFCALSEDSQSQSKPSLGKRRALLAKVVQVEVPLVKKKSSSPSPTKNQTKLLKPSTKKSNSIKTTKTQLDFEINWPTKLSNSTKTKLKKLNSTSKSSNYTKPTSLSKKTLDLSKPSTPKNKTANPISPKQTQSQYSSNSKNPDEKKPKTQLKKTTQKPTQPSWIEEEEQDDLVAEFRDLPYKFHQTLLPDIRRISTTSKAYLTKASKEITNGFKPFVGNKYAPAIASAISFAFILIPLLLVSLLFNRIKAYFSLQKILIFIQAYLSIYFSILCLSSLVTGLEPLKFFYATSQSTYVCLQVLQTLGYVFYLLLLLMYLVLVFSTDSGLGPKLLGLGQTFVGYAVGLHYYMAVFHRTVLHQPPKTNWRVHGIYATCFLVICLLAKAERRKKAYLEEGGAEGKLS
ncbi:uncharacterized protein LOC131159558 [Malania oleifera]|uniref:uncharacterized protein LOC131159558 n=1 Tax=Malania oleifera TaxID=397392 RepID=UPI0025ADDDA6|nr:uncharacterized protein LOC131159558 [Malania oleifera]